MIAIDTSALMAIALDEPQGRACMRVLEAEPDTLISAVTLAETLIVADRRKLSAEVNRLLDGLGLQVVSLTPAAARRAAAAYARWGRGVHPAALNLGDCFSYELAKEHSCPLLFVGNDFAQTDVERVI